MSRSTIASAFFTLGVIGFIVLLTVGFEWKTVSHNYELEGTDLSVEILNLMDNPVVEKDSETYGKVFVRSLNFTENDREIRFTYQPKLKGEVKNLSENVLLESLREKVLQTDHDCDVTFSQKESDLGVFYLAGCANLRYGALKGHDYLINVTFEGFEEENDRLLERVRFE
ncbi:hypothetical protein GYB22_11175 [bacterium]|nr:hypothetical protein [bacterium]